MARAKKGWTQGKLARVAEVDSSFISLIETGRRAPSLATLETFARALGVPVWCLAYLASDKADQSPEAWPALAQAVFGGDK